MCTQGGVSWRACRSCRVQPRPPRSHITGLGVSMAPYHPGQLLILTGYAPKINSYGPAHVSLSASTRVGSPGEPRGGCRVQPRPPRSHMTGLGVSMAPYHPGQLLILTGYAPNINSYGPAHVSVSAATEVGSRGEPVAAVASDNGPPGRISLLVACLRHPTTRAKR